MATTHCVGTFGSTASFFLPENLHHRILHFPLFSSIIRTALLQLSPDEGQA